MCYGYGYCYGAQGGVCAHSLSVSVYPVCQVKRGLTAHSAKSVWSLQSAGPAHCLLSTLRYSYATGPRSQAKTHENSVNHAGAPIAP